MADDRTPPPPPRLDDDAPEITPEGAEWEPAGSVVRKPPAPEPDPDQG